MVIHSDSFFPSSADRLRKLFKVIALDFEHEEEILKRISEYMKEAADQYEAEKKIYGKKFCDLKQVVSDLQRNISDKKYPNGVPYTKADLKAAKERLKGLKEDQKTAERKAKEAVRNSKKIQDNIELLNRYLHKRQLV